MDCDVTSVGRISTTCSKVYIVFSVLLSTVISFSSMAATTFFSSRSIVTRLRITALRQVQYDGNAKERIYSNGVDSKRLVLWAKESSLPDNENSTTVKRINFGGTVANSTSSILNTKIIRILSDPSLSSIEVQFSLQQLINSNIRLLNSVNIITILQRSAKRKDVDLSQILPLSLVCDILKREKRPLKSFEAASLLYALQMYSISTPGVWEYIVLLTFFVDKSSSFKGKDIGNSLYGLQNFNSDSIEIRNLLASLSKQIRRSADVLNSQEIGICLFGMKRMKHCPEVEDVILAITDKIEVSDEALGQQAIGIALHGLQQMSTDSRAVLAVIDALTKKMRASKVEMSPRAIGAGLMGLRFMKADGKEVRSILDVFSSKIRECSVNFNGISVSSSLHGLKSMNDSLPEVRAVLSALQQKIELNEIRDGKGYYHSKNIAHSLFGLSQMTKSAELKKMVSTLSKKIMPLGVQMTLSSDLSGGKRASKAVAAKGARPVATEFAAARLDPQLFAFTGKDIAFSLYGLQSAEDCPEVQELFSVLTPHIIACPYMSDKDISQALYGLQMQSASDLKDLNGLLSALTRHIDSDPARKFTAQSLGMSMLGLKRMSASSNEVRKLLVSLSKRIGQLDSQAIGNVLYSFQKMSSESKEVRAFLGVFADHMNKCDCIMSAQELSNALWGLQGMNSDFPEIRKVLSALTAKLADALAHAKKSKRILQFTPQGIGNALAGLQSMSDEVPEIVELIGYFPGIVMNCAEEFSPQDIGNAIFGLQGITSDSPEIRLLLAALSVRLEEIEQEFDGKHIGYCLSGLHNKDLKLPEVMASTQALQLHIARSKYGGEVDLLFLQYGKGMKVKVGETIQSRFGI